MNAAVAGAAVVLLAAVWAWLVARAGAEPITVASRAAGAGRTSDAEPESDFEPGPDLASGAEPARATDSGTPGAAAAAKPKDEARDGARSTAGELGRRALDRLCIWRPRRARLAGTLAFVALLGAVALRDHFDATITAGVGRDLAPWLARIEGAWHVGLRDALPHWIAAGAAFGCGALPLALALGTALAPVPNAVARTSWIAWCAAAAVLPAAALLPLSEPVTSGLVHVAPAADALWPYVPFSVFDADRDALVSLPGAALVAAALGAARARLRRLASFFAGAAVLLATCAVLAGESWFATLPLTALAGWLAHRTVGIGSQSEARAA